MNSKSEYRDVANCHVVVVTYGTYREVWYIGMKNGKWSGEVRAKLRIKNINDKEEVVELYP